MPINLDNVNISIRQFQAVSSGKYNAGEVKLKNETTLVEINNHVHWAGRNVKAISHDEVLAIKDAFVRALSQSGVGADAINRVRRELGLAPEGPADTTLAQRSIKPLSRQQIREILDRNAAAINQHEGAGTIRTEAEIHARYRPEVRQAQIQTRNQANAALMQNRTFDSNDRVLAFQRVIAGDIHFANPAEKSTLVFIAQKMRDTIMAHSHNNPSDAPDATLKYTKRGGAAVTFGLGMSERDFVNKMDDLLLQLKSDRQNYTDDWPAAEYNAQLNKAFISYANRIPLRFKEMADEIRADLVARFGDKAFPAKAQFSAIVSSVAIGNALDALTQAGEKATPAALKARILEEGAGEIARRAMDVEIAARLKMTASKASSVAIATAVLRRHPQIVQRLAAAQNPAGAAAVFDEFSAQINDAIRREEKCMEAKKACIDWCRETLAARMGVPKSSLETQDFFVRNLETKAGRLANAICFGENQVDTDAEIEAAFRRLANDFANARAALLDQADALDMPPETRDAIKAIVLRADKTDGIDLAAIKAAADAIPVNYLSDAIYANCDKDDILVHMGAVGSAIGNKTFELLNAQDGMLDETDVVGKMMLCLVLGKEPGLTAAAQAYLGRPDMIDVNLAGLEGLKSNAAVFMLLDPGVKIFGTNAALAGKIGKADCPPVAMQALYRAMDDVGLGNLPPVEKNKLVSASAKAIADRVRASAAPVSPALLRCVAQIEFSMAAAEEAAKRHAVNLAAELGFDLDAESAVSVKNVLYRRNPGLKAEVAAAVSRAAARGEDVQAAADAVLQQHAKLAEVAVRAFYEVAVADENALIAASAGIAEKADLDEALVRNTLLVPALRIAGGGALGLLKDKIREDLRNPLTDLETYDIAGISAKCVEHVNKFVNAKTSFIEKVRTMPVSDAMKANFIYKALAIRTWKDPELVDSAIAALSDQRVQNALAALRNIMTADKIDVMSDEEVFTTLEFAAKAIDAATIDAVPEEKRSQGRMDNEDWNVLRDMVNFAISDALGPAFTKALERLAVTGRFAKLEDLGIKILQQRRAENMEAMAPNLGTAENPVFGPPNEAQVLATTKKVELANMVLSMQSLYYTSLVDEWTTAEFADAFNSTTKSKEVNERVKAAVAKGPELFDKYSAGLGDPEKAALKALIVSLDLRKGALPESERAIQMKLREFRLAGEGFTVAGSPANAMALEMGYLPMELPRLQQVADLYRQATGCTEAAAYAAALDNTSAASRLFAYGGRFTESVEGFAAGLRLMDKFRTWFESVNKEIEPRAATYNGRLPPGASLTAINANTSYLKPEAWFAYEKFIFEDLATNPQLPIDVDDPAEVFAMENNPIVRFVARGLVASCANTFAQIPPEKRRLVVKVFDLLLPLLRTQEDAEKMNVSGENVTIVARIIRHYDEIAEMDMNGTLTRRTFCERFLPDCPGAAEKTYKQFCGEFSDNLYFNVIPANFGTANLQLYLAKVGSIMQTSGCTLDEAIAAIKENKNLPPVDYLSEANGHIKELNGTADGGRAQIILDLKRPVRPVYADGQSAVAPGEDVFTVAFPDGTKLKSGDEAQSTAVADKIAQFVGNVHPLQLNTVYFALSQSAHGPVLGAFTAFGIETSEHMALTYTLSRNAETGAVTIRYSEPQGFPVKFSWEATVALDGTITTAPATMRVEMLDDTAAKALVANAATHKGVRLDDAKTARAVELMRNFCTMMDLKQVAIFANFVVQLALAPNDDNDMMRAADMAKSIRHWRDFEPGQGNVQAVENVIKEQVADDIVQNAKQEKIADNYIAPDTTLHRAFIFDLGRSTVVINGKTHAIGATNVEEAKADFKNALAGKPNAQIAISSLMQQGASMPIVELQTHNPTPPTDTRPNPAQSFKAAGAEAFVNRGQIAKPGLYAIPQIIDNPESRNELSVSPDGNTAVVKIVKTGDALVGVRIGDHAYDAMAKVETVEEVTLDITGDNPRVIAVRLGQKVAP
ncbi:MAG: hypothetical protein IJL17_20350 [Kiritimatiellae bacterium]|nr:hypothetical protein [Kiritimatiellia bacterium]